jgi:DNA polymerase-1
MSDKKLYLVDGHALVYRAYFAFIKNPLINSKGQPTSAVFGFANYLIRLIESFKCEYLAVVLDSSVPTFRHLMYEQYKANREEMPGDLKAQMPLIRTLIDALNIAVVKEDGLEADDLIATLTRNATDMDFDVFLITKDKDLMQLLGPRVKMLTPEGTGTLQLFEEKDVKEKMGVPPSQIVDYLALIGDSSDNIPGVPGVGPKTAIKILDEVGSVDAILANPSIIQNQKLSQKIAENIELLRISKALATLKFECETPIDLEALRFSDFDKEKCVNLFTDLEFTSLVRHPLFSGGSKKITPVAQIIRNSDDLRKFNELVKQNKWVAIETMISSGIPRAADCIGVALSIDENSAVYIPMVNADSSIITALKEIVEDSSIEKIGHTIKTDYQVLKSRGILLKGIAFDTAIAAYILDPGKRAYDLEVLVPEVLKMDISQLSSVIDIKSGKTLDDLPDETVAAYAAEIVCLQILLKNRLESQINEQNVSKLLYDIEMPLVKVLGDLEYYGMLIDTPLLQEMSKEYTTVLDGICQEIYQLSGESFNVNSPKQVGEILFDKLQLPTVKKTKSGTHSTNVDVLEKLAPEYPIVQKILDHRELQKLLSTYIDALPQQILAESGRVHTSFNQTVAATGRLSSTNPNMQNIPIRTDGGKRIREAFIAQDGFMVVSADYSQIELRILAHMSNDPILVQSFIEDKDIHTQTASAIYGIFPEMVTPEMRRAAKTINFGLMYGMGPINLSRQLGISFAEAKKFIETYFHQFPTIKKYMETTIANARTMGYTETMLGRKRFLPDMNSSNKNIREAAERTAINAPVQGTAADIIKIAMIQIHNEIDVYCKDARMLLQVHDELVFEVPELQAESFCKWVADKMSNAFKLNVPLKVDAGFGKNWSDAH